MEGSSRDDLKNIIGLQFNLVPKVEPNDGEFVLCGEFVDSVPPPSTTTLPRTEVCRDPFCGGITGDNPFGLKELKIIAKDCLKELATIKADIKNEPEENIYDDSQASQEVDDSSTDENIAEHQPDSMSSNRNKRARRNPQNRSSQVSEKILSPAKKRTRGSYKYKDTSSSESDNDVSYNPKRKFGISASRKKTSTVTKGKKTHVDPLDQDKLTNDSPHGNEMLKIPQSDSMSLQEKALLAIKEEASDNDEAVDVSLSLIPTTSVSEGEQGSSQSNSASLCETTLSSAKKRKKQSYNGEDTNSDDDHDKSYNPKRSFRISAPGKKTSAENKGKSNKCKKTYLKTVPDKEKLKSDSRHIGDNALSKLQTFLKDLMPLPEEASLSVKKNDSDGDKAEVDGVLWSCCDMQFELFSAYNNHKTQGHLIEELKCSICIDQSFPSIEEIEKHYLDVHTDSSWTSFHCLDCRLVFGVKSSFFEHKAKCCESQSVCSGILDSIIDFAVTRKKSKKVKGNGNTAFRLSCCENIIENFEDFFFHKFSDHDISLLTCGLCLCVKDTETQLRSHYRKFHFSKFWDKLELKKCGDSEKGSASTVSSSTQNDDDLNKADDGPSNSDNVEAKPVQCSALQDGILCRCCDCIKLVEETRSLNNIVFARKKPFQCKPCNLQFHSKARLDRHLRTHEGIKPFPCDICGNAFTSRLSLRKHNLYKHSSNPFQKSCRICDKVFVSKSSLKRHIGDVHMCVNKNIQFKCEDCEKIYINRTSYLKHIRHFHTKLAKFICDHCSKVFYDKRSLIRHMQIMHLPNENYECQKCDRTFKTKAYLSVHNMKVHSDKQFNCEMCGKIFRTKIKLEQHMSVHSDDKPFVCQICGKRFKRYMNLQQHQYTHSESRPHVCDICGQTFRLRTHVKQHMAVHGIIRNHKCPVCGKAFARKTELNSHLLSHVK